MSKILTQEEIDALLVSARTIQDNAQAKRDDQQTDATIYNFRRPDRVSKEQIRSLHFLHDRFARNLATSMSAYLRAGTEITIQSVEQFSYSEVLMSLPDPTAFYALGLPPVDGLGALELNPSIAFTLVDRMLGGRGEYSPVTRSLTEIEQNVIDSVVKLILENLTEAWRPILEVHFKIHGRETRPQMLQVAAPNDVVVLLVFEMKIGDVRGMLNLIVPAGIVGANFAQGWHGTRRTPTPGEGERVARNLARVSVPLLATIESGLAARDILALSEGDVIMLGHPVSEPLGVRAWQTLKFLAHPVNNGECRALRVHETVAAPIEAGR